MEICRYVLTMVKYFVDAKDYHSLHLKYCLLFHVNYLLL
jgi:hypothetical protein